MWMISEWLDLLARSERRREKHVLAVIYKAACCLHADLPTDATCMLEVSNESPCGGFANPHFYFLALNVYNGPELMWE